MKFKFSKMHGCGNDYVYADCTQQEMSNPEAVAKYVSRYHYGIGSDGLILICPSETADFKMRMFNADGSEGKMCGNGIRCVAKYVYDHGLTDKNPVSIETLAGTKEIELTVENGKVTAVGSGTAYIDVYLFQTKACPRDSLPDGGRITINVP